MPRCLAPRAEGRGQPAGRGGAGRDPRLDSGGRAAACRSLPGPRHWGHGGGGLSLPVPDRAAGGRGRGQDVAAAALCGGRARGPRARARARGGAHGGRRVLQPQAAAASRAARQAAALGHRGPRALQVRPGRAEGAGGRFPPPAQGSASVAQVRVWGAPALVSGPPRGVVRPTDAAGWAKPPEPEA